MKRIAFTLSFVVTITSAASAQTLQTSAAAVRQSDSLLNGALIGAGVGVASGLAFCTTMEPWRNCRDDFGSMLKVGAIGAGIGMGIDALVRKKIYQSASGAAEIFAAPLVGRRSKGLRLSLRF